MHGWSTLRQQPSDASFSACVYKTSLSPHNLWLKETQRQRSEEQESECPRFTFCGETAMPDLEITCSECSTPFMFTEREQEYYRERNLTHPKRCKPCRDARRANFGGAKGQGGGERQRFEITCDQCGKNDSVPFKPSTGRPVLCSDCFSASRAQQRT